ncbi:hypothetical protein [Hafnia alvei]|uniref:hypothetical protein n=1 Tax=Hafnia alvei TaxID=569 RepID=UPI00187D13AE|nr:hypothetical protein [Hafnia alvei]MCE9872169.1 hypothetical protein [Hafnia alvei]
MAAILRKNRVTEKHDAIIRFINVYDAIFVTVTKKKVRGGIIIKVIGVVPRGVYRSNFIEVKGFIVGFVGNLDASRNNVSLIVAG